MSTTQSLDRPTPVAGRLLGFAYALLAYNLANAVTVYTILFGWNLIPWRAVDVGPAHPPEISVLVNVALIGLFGIQHSLMARPGFKAVLTRWLPQPLERATYLMATVAVLAILFLFWQPIPIELLTIEDQTLRNVILAVSAFGWFIALSTTFLIDHFELFALRQAWCWLRGKPMTYPEFQIKGYYKLVRHPMQFGILLAVWASPDITMGRVLFAGGLTLYVLIGLAFEERALRREFGDPYRAYQKRTPMLVPFVRF
ncbi:MAG: isoprenylcysteine carboxylmethyltransferase family protein [Pseudomonadota bacterium]